MKTAQHWCMVGIFSLAAAVTPGKAFAQPTSTKGNTATKRAYTVDDALNLEQIGMYFGGPFSFAPDGNKLAFTRVRTKSTLANLKWEYLWGNAGGDVWVQAGQGGTASNITNGVSDGSGWWSPQWSPDGNKLAMLSTRGGNVRIWLWDQSSGQPRLLSARGVDFTDPHLRPFLWLDGQHLLYSALPEGEQPFSMRVELDTPTIASREWPKVTKGKEATASVLDSGMPIDLAKRSHGQLRLVDLAGGEERVLVDATTSEWSIAPKHDVVAFARQTSVYAPKANEPLPFGNSETYGLGLATLNGKNIELKGDVSPDIFRDSLRWSPDGDQLAFLGYPGGDRLKLPVLYRVDIAQRTVSAQALGELDAAPIVRESAQLEWTGDGALLVLAVKRVGDAKPDVRARRDWWLIGKDGSRRSLTAQMPAAPGGLWAEPTHRSFVGLAKGKLWRVDPGSGKVDDLTVAFKPEIAQIAWPAYTNTGVEEWPQRDRTYTQLILGVRNGEAIASYRISLVNGKIDPIPAPGPKAELKIFEPTTETAIFYQSDRDGLYLWRRSLKVGKTDELIAANTYLREIASGQFKSIDYTSLDGKPLKAWLLLPPDYVAGKRYPLLTWVYAGSVAGPKPSIIADIGFGGSLNMQIPAAHGYAVLMPSMPLNPEGMVDDPMLRLPNGVLPAVDKVVELGIADPKRVFLMGQSFGGFSTYGLVTQTDRFAAAVSLAGLSDLISLYAQFDARMRYLDHPEEHGLFMMALAEAAQTRMGGPPWKDLGRYIRNSPIFQVDRVNTPLMIIQGDVDYVAIQQGEEFFNSLYRQGKRARFVRYWGEGHVLESPANIRDMWERIFGWFDEFPPKETVSAK